MKFTFFVLFLFCCFNSVIGQNYSFVSYSTSEGLPQSQVTSIVQDADGYLWIGTLGGLAKFNGKDFITYSSESGLYNNRISFLTFIDGVIWVGHQGGVTSIDKNIYKTWALNGDARSVNVKSIFKFKSKICVATNGAGLFEIKKEKFLKIPVSHFDLSTVRDVYLLKDEFYFATPNGLIYTKDFKKISKIDSLEGYNLSGVDLWKNKLVISTFEGGLFVVNPITKKIKKVQLKNNNLIIKNVFVDTKNNCWVNTENGFFKINFKNKIEFIDESKGLPLGAVGSIYEDDRGGIWIGTLGKGLLRFPEDQFVYYDRSSGLSSDLILNVNQTSNGCLWFSTFDKGVVKMSKTGVFSFLEFPNNRVWTSASSVNNYDWFGTEDGLIQIDSLNQIKVLKVGNDQLGYTITSILKVSSSEMYIGGTAGISVYKNGAINPIRNIHKYNIGTVRDFVLYKDKLYCATSNGLFVYKDKVLKKIRGINKEIFCIEKDENNDIWIGTEEGLFVYDKEIIKRISISETPSSNLINFLNYHYGKMYVGTNEGLFVIKNILGSDKKSISHFGKEEGLVDLETNINSSFFDNKGSLWFGTSSGLVKYVDNEYSVSRLKPIVNFKSILLNYAPFDYSKYSVLNNKNGVPSKLNFPYFKNNIIFEIEGISLRNYSHLSYQFWLEGLDESWSPKSKNTVISFTGLNPGAYILHVRAVTNEGFVSTDKSISFKIKSPFYKTWWFVVLVLLFLAMIVYKVFKFKIKRELEKKENEMMDFKSKLITLEQKSLNASMNRHFIFNSLNSIQYFINSQDRLSANRYLTNFAKLIRKNLDSTNEDGNMISLCQEIEGLELYLSLESMRFKDKFSYVFDIEGVDSESIYLPAMLLQPFVENSIIHGVLPNENKKGLILIKMRVFENVLNIEIHDNGIGIKSSLSIKSLDKGDHRSQGMEITSKRIELIKKILHQGFEIIGPFQIEDDECQVCGTRVLIKIPFENLDE